MGDRYQAQSMLRAATSDLKSLRSKLNSELHDETVFGFHAQQAIEKSLKAWLAQLEQRFPYSHDLDMLLRLLENTGANVSPSADMGSLTPFAVE